MKYKGFQTAQEAKSFSQKLYHISYVKDGIGQAILVEAANKEEAEEKFIADRGEDACMCGCSIANQGDMKPGKPIIR